MVQRYEKIPQNVCKSSKNFLPLPQITMKLEDYLRQHAEETPDRIAVICGDETVSYATLYQRVQARVATMPQGKVVVFRSSHTIDFLVTYFAIHLAGSVAAPLEHDTPEPLFQEISALSCTDHVADHTLITCLIIH